MFWRNPTAAFFNFLLPLLLLGDVRRDLRRRAGRPRRDRARDRRDERDVDDLHGARLQPDLPARARDPQAPARHAAAVVGLPGRDRRQRGHQHGRCRWRSSSSPAGSSSASRWPRDWLALLVFVALGVVCFAALGVALSHAIPNSESAPAYVNAVFLPMIMIAGRLLRRRGRARGAARPRRGAAAQAPDRRAVGRDGRRRRARRHT